MDPKPPKHIQCPTCGKTLIWCTENIYRPFCSERCRLIDLGAWADETYRIESEKPLNNNEEDN